MAALIAAVTSCISVIVTGSIAILTLRQSRAESKSERAHRYMLEILPRRLDALESTWRMVFELEAGVSLSQDRIDQLIQDSIWLPKHIRDNLIALLVNSENSDAAQISRIRNELLKSSGTAQIDFLQKDFTLEDVSVDRSERY